VVATIALSLSGLQVGAWIVLRVIVLLLAGSSFSAHISVTQIALLFEGIGLRGLGFALGVALNALPLTVRSVQDTWQALRLRGGLRRAWWRGIRLFLVATTVQIALRAEETLQAIYLRAFDPERRGQRLPWQRGDLFLSIGLIMLGVILILL
jgi:energy-coupling factor transporter transmembrane protein EcfT